MYAEHCAEFFERVRLAQAAHLQDLIGRKNGVHDPLASTNRLRAQARMVLLASWQAPIGGGLPVVLFDREILQVARGVIQEVVVDVVDVVVVRAWAEKRSRHKGMNEHGGSLAVLPQMGIEVPLSAHVRMAPENAPRSCAVARSTAPHPPKARHLVGVFPANNRAPLFKRLLGKGKLDRSILWKHRETSTFTVSGSRAFARRGYHNFNVFTPGQVGA